MKIHDFKLKPFGVGAFFAVKILERKKCGAKEKSKEHNVNASPAW